MTTPDSTARSDSVLGGDSSGALPSARAATASPPSPSVSGIAGIANADIGRVELPMDHPLVKALHREVREKQEARERLERQYYVDPRDLPPMGAA